MQSIEITGKTAAEATKAAAGKLGVSEDQLTITVLEETKGLFGKSNVRIRAEVKAGGQSQEAAPAAVAAQEEATSVAEEKPAKKPRASKAAKKDDVTVAEAPVVEEVALSESAESEVVATVEDGAKFVDLIHDLVAKADLEVTAKVTQAQGRYVNIELDGKDVAYLVGKHGEVLNALQYLVNIMAGRSFGNGIRATIDGNHYRNRREQQLTAHAQRVADEVKKRGEEAVLDALPAFERRIVHKALSEYDGVSTYSEGEEPNRRVVIAPAE